MKTLIASLLVLLVATSCGKWNGKKDKKENLEFYCVDFMDKDMDILGINTSDIDKIWVEFYGEGVDKDEEFTHYSLIVKSDGEFTKEHGTCDVDWGNSLNFNPEGGSSYDGDWIYEKEKYTISYDLKERLETLTFVYKVKKECW